MDGYIAIDGNKVITLDAARSTKTIIFDAMTGSWPGSGFFVNFPSSTLFEATLGTISNDYINESAYQVGESSSSSNCEYFPGIGTICGGDYDENLIEREYFLPRVGPAGLYTLYSISDWSSPDGGWSSSNTTNIGLVASSLWGDVLDYTLEVEPNNNISDATPITIPANIEGDSVSESEFGETTDIAININSIDEVEPNDSPFAPQSVDFPAHIAGNVLEGDQNTSVEVTSSPSGGTTYTTTFEDWYQLTLGTGKTINVDLSFDNSGADLDMYLFSLDVNDTVIIHANSVDDNVGTNNFNEHLSQHLSSGTYFLAIDAYATSGGRADYTLDISTEDSSIEICDWFSFTLEFQSQITISVTAGVTFVLTDGTVSTTLATGGSQDASVSLDAGNYLIGISRDGVYNLNVTTP